MEAVGQLTGGIAHDFNNMLAVVVGGIDLALRRLNGPRREVMMHLNNAMEGATRAAALTRRLLSFARSEPLLPERVDSNELIGGMSDLLDRTLGERIRIEVDLARDTWPIYVDPHQLENAIVNLAVNARDAMDGAGLMRIATENVTLAANEVGDIRPGEYVKISVTDTGCGMPPDVLERAFEPFFTTKPVGKGTGLGLSQIFGFAHQSGGEVGIESQVGAGTTVSIYLPRTEAAATGAAPSGGPAHRDADVHVAGARILLVEDDPRVRTATVGALEDLDYDPVACGSGAEAIELFNAQEFDLVITDVIMPEMTGPELIRHLKATSRATSRCCSSPAMSAKARATTCAATSCCASPSPSARWPARSPPRSPARLANRPGLQQPRQEADPGEQRMALLPRLQLDVGPGVAVDLPRDIIRAAGEGQARLGQAQRPKAPSLRSAASAQLPCGLQRSIAARSAGAVKRSIALGIEHRRPSSRGPCARRAARRE